MTQNEPKLFLIGGVPASGKTTLVKRLIEHLGGIEEFEFRKCGLVTYHYRESDRVGFLGDFRNWSEKFSSTDKWSMAVEPQMKAWLKLQLKTFTGARVFGEGDRVFTAGIIKAAETYLGEQNVKAITLTADKSTLDTRHRERKDNQTERFLKSRETKYANLRRADTKIEIWQNDEGTAEENFQKLISWVSRA